MKTFQKIKSFENELLFEEKLRDRGVEVTTIEPGDEVLITEKVDGSNAQVVNVGGELEAYSHHRHLNEDNTLNGFYGFVKDSPVLDRLPKDIALFGEWLSPHKIKYKNEAYKKFYLFDVFNFETNTYGGYPAAKELYDSFLDLDSNIQMAPLLKVSTDTTQESLINLQNYYSTKSELSLTGEMEGIVAVDLTKAVPVDPECNGPLRVKLVNSQFKETRQEKGVASDPSDSISQWLNSNVTLPRIRKQIFSMQENGDLKDEPSFDWLSNGITDAIAMEALLDAMKESEELPESLKKLVRYSKKQTNKFVALTVKGLI